MLTVVASPCSQAFQRCWYPAASGRIRDLTRTEFTVGIMERIESKAVPRQLRTSRRLHM